MTHAAPLRQCIPWTQYSSLATILSTRDPAGVCPHWLPSSSVTRGFGAATARELQTCTFVAPRYKNTTKIPRKDPQRERRKKENCGGRGKKKRENLAPHPSGSTLLGSTLLGSTLLGSTILGSTLLGSSFSRFGPPPWEASTLRGVTVRAPPSAEALAWSGIGVEQVKRAGLKRFGLNRSLPPKHHYRWAVVCTEKDFRNPAK